MITSWFAAGVTAAGTLSFPSIFLVILGTRPLERLLVPSPQFSS